MIGKSNVSPFHQQNEMMLTSTRDETYDVLTQSVRKANADWLTRAGTTAIRMQ